MTYYNCTITGTTPWPAPWWIKIFWKLFDRLIERNTTFIFATPDGSVRVEITKHTFKVFRVQDMVQWDVTEKIKKNQFLQGV